MSTCSNDKLLFVHVPKTGGMWVYEAMKAAGVEVRPRGREHHFPLRNLKRRGRFTFAFVREPLSWYGSWWSYQRKLGNGPGTHVLNEWIERDFPGFIEAMVEHRPGKLMEHFEACVGPPENPIDFVGRYENLVDDLVTALELAGQDFDEDVLRALPPVNVSRPPPECPETLRDALRVSEAGVYERFYSAVLA